VKCTGRYTKNGCKEANKLEIVKRHENNCKFKIRDDCGLARSKYEVYRVEEF
jgi:hypothetical protein